MVWWWWWGGGVIKTNPTPFICFNFVLFFMALSCSPSAPTHSLTLLNWREECLGEKHQPFFSSLKSYMRLLQIMCQKPFLFYRQIFWYCLETQIITRTLSQFSSKSEYWCLIYEFMKSQRIISMFAVRRLPWFTLYFIRNTNPGTANPAQRCQSQKVKVNSKNVFSITIFFRY